MNQITTALREAYASRQTVGEEVTFRSEKLFVAQINRAPGKRERERFQFDEHTQSIVELPPDLTEPSAGETILDQFDRYHRIQQIAFDGICWVCGCAVSAATT